MSAASPTICEFLWDGAPPLPPHPEIVYCDDEQFAIMMRDDTTLIGGSCTLTHAQVISDVHVEHATASCKRHPVCRFLAFSNPPSISVIVSAVSLVVLAVPLYTCYEHARDVQRTEGTGAALGVFLRGIGRLVLAPCQLGFETARAALIRLLR